MRVAGEKEKLTIWRDPAGGSLPKSGRNWTSCGAPLLAAAQPTSSDSKVHAIAMKARHAVRRPVRLRMDARARCWGLSTLGWNGIPDPGQRELHNATTGRLGNGLVPTTAGCFGERMSSSTGSNHPLDRDEAIGIPPVRFSWGLRSRNRRGSDVATTNASSRSLKGRERAAPAVGKGSGGRNYSECIGPCMTPQVSDNCIFRRGRVNRRGSGVFRS